MEAAKRIEVKAVNANRPATSKQLFALWIASRANNCEHDYRNDNLTMQQASELLQKFNANKAVTKPKIGLTMKQTTTNGKMSVRANKPSLR